MERTKSERKIKEENTTTILDSKQTDFAKFTAHALHTVSWKILANSNPNFLKFDKYHFYFANVKL